MSLFDQVQSLSGRAVKSVLDKFGRTVTLKRRTATHGTDNSTSWSYVAYDTPKVHLQPVIESRRVAVYGAASNVESEAIASYDVGVQSGDALITDDNTFIVAKAINDSLAGTTTVGLRQPTAAEAAGLAE